MLGSIGPISPNWHKITSREHINHALYHIYRLLSSDVDEEHLAHAACRVMFALEVDLMKDKASKCPKCGSPLGYDAHKKEYTQKCDLMECGWEDKRSEKCPDCGGSVVYKSFEERYECKKCGWEGPQAGTKL